MITTAWYSALGIPIDDSGKVNYPLNGNIFLIVKGRTLSKLITTY
jgi:hypothetical protein